MSSILTNMAAMTAVQNLAATQKSLADTQNQISTGLKVSSAQDNAAYYSIATNMRTNIGDLSAVSDSLNLGSSVVATATSATSNLTTVLQSISKALVSASQPATDLNSVQTNIAALRTQLANTVATSSFNGVNLLDASNSANPQVKFVAGVTGIGANTTVNTLTIDTTNTNFQGAAYATGGNTLVDAKLASDTALATATTTLATATTAKTAATTANTTAQTNLTTATTANTNALTALTNAVTAATSAQLQGPSSQFTALFGASATVSGSGVISNIQAGSLAATLVGTDGTLTISKAATGATGAAGTASTTLTYGVGATATGTLGSLYGAGATNATTTGTATSADGLATAAAATLATATTAFNTATTGLATATTAQTSALAAVNADTTASNILNGQLFSISQISLTSGDGTAAHPATSATQIAALIKQVGAALTAVNNASETLGAASSNISLQSTYTTSLSNSLTSGVGSLVDADMNAASTRLAALQTQQQLGVQALSVANQNSQLILKLFGG